MADDLRTIAERVKTSFGVRGDNEILATFALAVLDANDEHDNVSDFTNAVLRAIERASRER